ncbi:MAG: tRNA pseudouridine(13) synthase TruD [Chloroflexi bacterium]|nr:tRNA pseudouridine(13) synthase TruD [Chloroflexota bacterium]
MSGIVTVDLPGVGGIVRLHPEDFYVEEIPAYSPSGSGPHTLFEIEKRGIDTFAAIRLISRELGESSRLIGSAGLKDANAVTRQHLSIEGVAPERLLNLHLPNVRILWAEKHRNRLKIGHLHGNRFVIRIRQVDGDALARAERILQYLSVRGLPNGYGIQRFGIRGVTHLLGCALLRNDLEQFFAVYLGCPQPEDSAQERVARELYDNGNLEGALQHWPYINSDEYRALRIIQKGALAAAYYSLPRELLRLTLSAYQSYLFNLLLQQRLPTYDCLETGDLAYKHANGVCFSVTDVQVEQVRADHLEISATAPLYGRKVRLAEGVPGERERALLAQEGLTLETMHPHGFSLEGERRPLRVPLSEVSVSQEEHDLIIRFTLPPGAFATNLLREVMKTPEQPH